METDVQHPTPTPAVVPIDLELPASILKSLSWRERAPWREQVHWLRIPELMVDVKSSKTPFT